MARKWSNLNIPGALHFVTGNFLDRIAIFNQEACCQSFIDILSTLLTEWPCKPIAYVLMPDHIHLFVCGDGTFRLAEWVKGLKRAISAVFPKEPRRSLWQPGFFDHLLRNDESYDQKWTYVCENPVRAGLVSKVEDWPFQGEFVEIDRT